MGPTDTGPTSSRQGRLRGAAVPLATLGVAFAGIVVFDPVHHDVPLCPFHATTGLWCPFCGGLRAVWLLAHLQIGAAASSSLVVFALAPWFAWRAFRTVTGRPPVVPRWKGRPLPGATVPVVVVTLLVVYTVVRNLPAGSWLAPAG